MPLPMVSLVKRFDCSVSELVEELRVIAPFWIPPGNENFGWSLYPGFYLENECCIRRFEVYYRWKMGVSTA